MPGHEPGDVCLHDHVRPYLDRPKPTDGGDGYRAYAPCHDDREPSLSVSIGRNSRVVWFCHSCSERIGKKAAQMRTRSALIRAGVPARCLPFTREQVDNMVDEVREVLHSDIGMADKVYRLAAMVECGEMPKGAELDQLAEWCRLSRRAAYGATARARQGSTDNPVPNS